MSQSHEAKPSREKTTEQDFGRVDTHVQGSASTGVHADILNLQHSTGNQAVNQALKASGTNPGHVQGKLTINQPGDRYEQEAVRIADQVMRMPDNEVGTKKPSVTPVQTQSVQRYTSSGQTPTVTPSVQAKIEALQRSGGEPLPESMRAFMEPRLGRDLSAVRIHSNFEANNIAAHLKAMAFTVGNHVAFARGQFLSLKSVNKSLLAHELVHTQQQLPFDQSVIQRAPIDESLSESTDMELSDVESEPQLKRAPSKDLAQANSKLEKQLNRLNYKMETVLRALFGEQRGDEDIFESDVSESQLKTARRAVSRYRRITRILESLPLLDIAFAAKWLNVLLFTIRVLRYTLKELSASGEVGALIAEVQDTQLRRIFNRARKLKSKKAIKRGAKLAEAAEEAAELSQRAESENKLPEALGKITSNTQRQTVGMSDTEIDVEIQNLLFRRQLETDPTKIQVIDAIIEGLEAGKVEERKRFAETPLVALKDRLTTVEHVGRERSAELINEIDELDLRRLAESPKDRSRIADLGLRLSQSTTFEAATEVGVSILPVIGEDLANIATGRLDEEKAIQRLSRAMALAGGPSEHILVPEMEQLAHFKVIRKGNNIILSKSELLLGIERSDPKNPDKNPKSQWTFAPSDLVTLTVAGSGQSVTLPAFGLLHIKDKASRETAIMWAALLEMGVGFTRASIAATKAEIRAGSALTDAEKITSRSSRLDVPPSKPTKPQQADIPRPIDDAVPGAQTTAPPRAGQRSTLSAGQSAAGKSEQGATISQVQDEVFDFPRPSARVRGPRKFLERHRGRLESKDGAVEDIFRRTNSPNNPVARRSGAAELAALVKNLKTQRRKENNSCSIKKRNENAVGGITRFCCRVRRWYKATVGGHNCDFRSSRTRYPEGE